MGDYMPDELTQWERDALLEQLDEARQQRNKLAVQLSKARYGQTAAEEALKEIVRALTAVVDYYQAYHKEDGRDD